MTKKQLEEYCVAEFENIDKVLYELSKVVMPGKSEYANADLAAIATFLHNSYNGMENVLKRVLAFESVRVTEIPTWHKDLLKTATQKGIISEDLQKILGQYLSFRHFFVHAYSFALKWKDLEPLVSCIWSAVQELKERVFAHIEASAQD